MKLINPFRRHLVRFDDGRYGVRRLTLMWLFLDIKDRDHWWCMYIDKYAKGTEAEAREVLRLGFKRKAKPDRIGHAV